MLIVRNGTGYDSRYTLINIATGERITPEHAGPEFIYHFSDGLARMHLFDNTVTFIDKTGKTVLSKLASEKIGCNFAGGFTFIGKPGADSSVYALMNKSGKLLTDYVYLNLEGGSWDNGQLFNFDQQAFIDNITGTGKRTDAGKRFVILSRFEISQSKLNAALNGKEIQFPAFNIDGNNYVKLRDLASALSDTAAQFDVYWDGASIQLYNGRAYTPSGTELTTAIPNAVSGVPASIRIIVDDSDVTLTAWNFGGNNYFKLRDIAEVFNFDVNWRDNKIWIEPNNPYTED
jgi:hypothetical protein